MQINIYVVKTEIEKLIDQNKHKEFLLASANLEILKLDLIKLFNGLTVIKNCLGYWLNSFEKLETDKTEIWNIILAENKNGLLIETEDRIERLAQIIANIKKTTKQKCQFYTIDNKPYYI
jgi:hypothetical protein